MVPAGVGLVAAPFAAPGQVEGLGALADPGIKAMIATTGGKGAYRIAAGLEVAAARRHPKLLIGFSEITILHLALFAGAGLPGIHGAPWGRQRFGDASADSFVHAVTRPRDGAQRPPATHRRPDDQRTRTRNAARRQPGDDRNLGRVDPAEPGRPHPAA